MRIKSVTACVAAVALGGACASSAGATTIKVYGSTAVQDSNLLAGLIAPAYLSATGNTINYMSVGAGPALQLASIGSNHADVVIANSPSLESDWVANGNSDSDDLGRALFYNDYAIVGPTTDPAGVISGGDRHDAVAALEDIAAAGGAGNAVFSSRDDDSGTNGVEQVIWGLTGGSVAKQLAWNRPAGNTTRYTPWNGNPSPTVGNAHRLPSWYVSTPLGQADNLTATDGCSPQKCYTIVDSGTWAFVNPSHLQIVSDQNSSGATGGAGLLTNPFHGYVVKSSSNKVAAAGFLDFLTSETFQRSSLPSFMVGGAAAAIGDAFPAVSTDTLPGTAYTSQAVSFDATLVYAPPVALAIAGLPVQLQHSINGGPYTNITGATSTSNGSGQVSYSVTTMSSPGDECFQLSMGQYDDSDAGIESRFMPNANNELGPYDDGCVTVSAPPSGLKIYGSTAVTDSNLLAGLIAPAYLTASGHSINYLAMGTGAALDAAAIPANNADVVIANAPSLEALWVAANHSEEALGRAIFYNKYFVVGPKTTDPAGIIAGGDTFDTIAAFEDIAAAGGSGTARFLSRDNASGTNVQEQVNWGLTGGSVTKQLAWNGGGDPTRYTPWDGTNTHAPHNFPTWYVSNPAGQAANLNTTNSCSPANCYTMVDSGTWAFVAPANLRILNQDNTGGSNPGLQTNPFHAYVVKTAPNKAAALGFLDFITTETFQRSSLPSFIVGGTAAAVGSAFAETNNTDNLPATKAAGTTLSFNTKLQYAPPVPVAIVGLAAQLKHSINGGPYLPYSPVKTSTSASGTGQVSYSVTVSSTPGDEECFELSMPDYLDFDAGVESMFMANNNTDLGPNDDGCITVT